MREVDDYDFTEPPPAVQAEGAATEKELGALHRQVAIVLKEHLASPGEGGLSAAMVGAAITFLKNNSITASPTENAALADLNKALNKKRRKGMDRKELDEAAEAYSAVAGNRLQ